MSNGLKSMLHRDAVVELMRMCSDVVVGAAYRNDPEEAEAIMRALQYKMEHCDTTSECPKPKGSIIPFSFGGYWWVDENGNVSQ